MRFTAALSTLLLGVSLTTSVLAAPKPVEPQLQRRDQNLDKDIDADDKTWEYFAGKCGGGASKRSLYARASNNVDVGKSAGWNIPIGLKTVGLKPCVGVVITGKTKSGSDFRVLGHFLATKGEMERQWLEFQAAYNGVGEIDKDSTKGYMSVPDHKKEYEGSAVGFYKTEDGDQKDARKLSKEIEEELEKRVENLVDGNPQMFPRDVDSAATMEVTGENKVLINDQEV
jgi:hypothetical protein